MPEDKSIDTYDLIVIGGGPAGIAAASVVAEAGKHVALIDAHHELGGAGINTGTVPSKTLRETALALSGLKSRNLYGVDLSVRRKVTVADFLGHEQYIRTVFNSVLAKRFKTQKADVYCGQATFVDPHTVRITPRPEEASSGTTLIRSDHILIATGSSPVRPPLFFGNQGETYDSDTILQLDRLPTTLAVIGAGVIGCEYACTFSALETKVHLIDGRDALLPFLDREVSQALAGALQRNGIIFHWKEEVKSCSIPSEGGVTLTLSSGTTLTVDAVLVAAGRQSNSETLNLAAAGINTGKRGLILVDSAYCTNVPHIYAAGDVIGFPALASVSIEQARRAVRHMFGLQASILSPLLPNGIYTIPEVSMVGETEESLQKQGIEYVVGRADYRDNARGRIIGDEDGFLKLIFRRSDMKLLGVHIMGEQATEIVHIGLMAMHNQDCAEVFVEACFNMPTLSSLYKSATLHALHSAGLPATPSEKPPAG